MKINAKLNHHLKLVNISETAQSSIESFIISILRVLIAKTPQDSFTKNLAT